ncbi:MAG TPA: mandelate racemase/muconate lactonizing enzyme family protein [Acidimicrobiales bacterium]|nr:mandelate racemase/muconate lactonizing enzyme family protein [Acidimicrobiales bacterium]
MPDHVEVTVWRVPTPLPRPVLTPLGPFDTFFHLVVTAEDSDGTRGWGYSALPTVELLDDTVRCACELVRHAAPTLAGLLGVEHAAVGPVFGGTVRNAAANAIALAAWDLAGRRLGLACADLWGRRPHTDSVLAYASGFFLDGSPGDLRREAEGYHAAGFRLVKMRVGLDVETDLQRLGVVRAMFPDPGQIAVDAVSAWSAADTEAFVAGAGPGLLWVEDPIPYAELPSLAFLRAPLAAGESLESAGELAELARLAHLDHVLLDVQRLGGPTRFLAAASALAEQGFGIGAHINTASSVHLLACLDAPLPVEVFDWSDPLFARPPAPGADGRVPVAGPGFGVDLDEDVLRRHGQVMTWAALDP